MPRNIPVTVHYNKNQTPPVKCTPEVVNVPKDLGILQFRRQPGQRWSFIGIKDADTDQPLPTPPFGDPVVAEDLLTLDDDNTPGIERTFNYCIGIQTEDGPKWSDPQIVNRAN